MLEVLALASGLFTTLLLGSRTETRLRAVPGATPGSLALAWDLETTPYVRLEARTHRLDFKLDYAADITVPDIETGFAIGPQLFQIGDMSLWYTIHDWTFGASEGGGIGAMNFTFMTPYSVHGGQDPGPAPIQLIPCADLEHCASEVVELGASASSVVVRYKHNRSSFAIAPTYTVSGGVDDASRKVFPLLSLPSVDASFEYTLGRRDGLQTRLFASASDSTPRACDPTTGGPPLDRNDPNPPTCAPRAQWVTAYETWHHRMRRRLSLELTAGATVARYEIDPSQSYKVLPYPVVGALVDYTMQSPEPDRPALHVTVTDPPKPSFYVYTRVGPVVDPFWGLVDPRVAVGAATLFPLDVNNTMLGRVAFLRSLPPTSLDATFLEGDVEVLHRLDKYRFEVGGGVRGAYQNDPFSGRFYLISAYLTFIWHEPRFKF